MKTINISCGDINGIGPEIAIKTIEYFKNITPIHFNIFVPKNVFEFYYDKTNSTFNSDLVTIYDLGDVDISLGQPTKLSGEIAYQAIKEAFNYTTGNPDAAIITAPISKNAFNLAGIDFPGHTELIADLCNSKKYLMTFISDKLKCALATIHIPLKDVAANLSYQKIQELIEIVYEMLIKDFNILEPSIAVLGLNPHAGEKGRIGAEEDDIIIPAISNLRKNGVDGPFVPDAFFAMKKYEKYDIVVGMYHDQVLIPFKMIDFTGVNYTAGLPLVRTSPDHGVAFDIAGENIANPASMINAVKIALNIIESRKNYAQRKL